MNSYHMIRLKHEVGADRLERILAKVDRDLKDVEALLLKRIGGRTMVEHSRMPFVSTLGKIQANNFSHNIPKVTITAS